MNMDKRGLVWMNNVCKLNIYSRLLVSLIFVNLLGKFRQFFTFRIIINFHKQRATDKCEVQTTPKISQFWKWRRDVALNQDNILRERSSYYIFFFFAYTSKIYWKIKFENGTYFKRPSSTRDHNSSLALDLDTYNKRNVIIYESRLKKRNIMDRIMIHNITLIIIINTKIPTSFTNTVEG
jgi:hypothetical protein